MNQDVIEIIVHINLFSRLQLLPQNPLGKESGIGHFYPPAMGRTCPIVGQADSELDPQHSTGTRTGAPLSAELTEDHLTVPRKDPIAFRSGSTSTVWEPSKKLLACSVGSYGGEFFWITPSAARADHP